MERRVVTVLGGSGFIGRYVVQRLAADGWVVRAAVRDTERALFLKIYGQPGQIVPMSADVADPQSVARVVENATAVVNLVGILYERGRRTFRRIHVDGAANVAQAARAAGAQRLVQMSAIGADADSSSEYGRTKREGEVVAQEAFPGASITRPSIVFGPEDNFFNRFAAMARFMPALPVFDTRFQPVYAGDVAEAIARILSNSTTAGRTYELGGPQILNFRQLMEIMLDEIGRRRMLVPFPLGLAELEAWFLEKLPKPLLTRDQVALLRQDNIIAPGALTLADLGIQPTALAAILPGYLSRYRPPAMQRRG